MFDNHLSSDPLLQFWSQHPIIFTKVTRKEPIIGATLIFTYGSKNGTGAITVNNVTETLLFNTLSAQQTELLVAIEVFRAHHVPFNLFSDSKCC